ncbi:alpha/beta fold hydrolase [Gordonia sp. NPDC003376]
MREDIWFDQVHGYHYPAVGDAEYSLLIVHGIGGHGGTYDTFAGPLGERGVEVVSMDLPGHGMSRNPRGDWRFEQWLADIDTAATAMSRRWDKPVFVLGSSQGSAAAFHSLATSEAVAGAVTMCLILTEVEPSDGSPLARNFTEFRSPEGRAKALRVGDDERIDLTVALDWNKNYGDNDPDILGKKQRDGLRAWSYGYASMASYYTYTPSVPAAANHKPVLVTVGERDPIVPVDYVRRCFDVIGGPATLEVIPGGTHQLMLYHTDVYLPLVDRWIREQCASLPTGSAAGPMGHDDAHS